MNSRGAIQVRCGRCRRTSSHPTRPRTCFIDGFDLDGRSTVLGQYWAEAQVCPECGYTRRAIEHLPRVAGERDDPYRIDGLSIEDVPSAVRLLLIAAQHEAAEDRWPRAAELVVIAAWMLEDEGGVQLARPALLDAAHLFEHLAMARRKRRRGEWVTESFLLALRPSLKLAPSDSLLVASDLFRRAGEFDRARDVVERAARLIDSLPEDECVEDRDDLRMRLAAERWALREGTRDRVREDIGETITTDAENTRYLAALTPEEWEIAKESGVSADLPGMEGMLERERLAYVVRDRLRRHHADKRVNTAGANRFATAQRVFRMADTCGFLAEALRRWKSPGAMAYSGPLLLEKMSDVTDPEELVRLIKMEVQGRCPRCGLAYNVSEADGIAACHHCGWKEV